MQVFLGVCADMDVVMNLVPEQLTYEGESMGLKQLVPQYKIKKQTRRKTIKHNHYYLTTILTFKVSVDFPEPLIGLHIEAGFLKRRKHLLEGALIEKQEEAKRKTLRSKQAGLNKLVIA